MERLAAVCACFQSLQALWASVGISCKPSILFSTSQTLCRDLQLVSACVADHNEFVCNPTWEGNNIACNPMPRRILLHIHVNAVFDITNKAWLHMAWVITCSFAMPQSTNDRPSLLLVPDVDIISQEMYPRCWALKCSSLRTITSKLQWH